MAVNIEVVLVVVALFAFTGIYAALMLTFNRRVDLRRRLYPQSHVKAPRRLTVRRALDRVVRTIKPLGEIIPRSPEEMSRQELRLSQAGIRHRDSGVLFLGIQAAAAIWIIFLFTIFGSMRQQPLVCLALGVLLGALIPDLVLKRLIARRKERIQLALPDALDLTVVSVEAGLSLDQSLLRIGEHIKPSYPELADELHLTNIEINMGRSRQDALRNLGKRTGVVDVKSLCAVLIQTDRFGTGIGQALRVYSESLRTRRRQRAEERAAKITVKMIPALVLCVFPAMFAIVVGPAIIALIHDLLPVLAGP
jgi:tight adherence protein C